MMTAKQYERHVAERAEEAYWGRINGASGRCENLIDELAGLFEAFAPLHDERDVTALVKESKVLRRMIDLAIEALEEEAAR